MRWFGKAARPEARPALARGFAAAGGGDWPQGYEAQLRAAYLGNPVAQRAVRLVAEGAASVPVAVTPEGHRAGALIAGGDQGGPLIETMAAQLLLHGNAFVQILADADGAPAELFALRPERVTIEPDARGWPQAYLYRAGGQTLRLAARGGDGRPGLIHVRGLNPLDDHYGLGCLAAAAGPVAIHNAATRWNKALLDNAARPSGALVYEPGEPGATLSAEQFERLRREMDASFAGAGNAGRPLLLEGGLRWQPLSLSPADMDFIGLKAAAARDIALAFGVPPMLLGLPGDSTHANYSEANRALWRLTILPLVGKMLDALAAGLRGWWPELALRPALDAVPALAADRERIWAQVAQADFLSGTEKRAMLGLARAEEA
ncbi:phage portal protein [Sphingomonas morindae]|uniref:Phage portal protein n=1 Tax=Sphingomonas morindae TaxID=1541170 RepID=A0ABY4X3K1_9SPHN|nr:phage portal protein [Sphingomonas morindae]USI71465.1 phage portal protein [Sphingomonas morindae]